MLSVGLYQRSVSWIHRASETTGWSAAVPPEPQTTSRCFGAEVVTIQCIHKPLSALLKRKPGWHPSGKNKWKKELEEPRVGSVWPERCLSMVDSPAPLSAGSEQPSTPISGHRLVLWKSTHLGVGASEFTNLPYRPFSPKVFEAPGVRNKIPFSPLHRQKHWCSELGYDLPDVSRMRNGFRMASLFGILQLHPPNWVSIFKSGSAT